MSKRKKYVIERFLRSKQDVERYFDNDYAIAKVTLVTNTDPKARDLIIKSYDAYINADKFESEINDGTWSTILIKKYGKKFKEDNQQVILNAENSRENMKAYIESFKPLQRFKSWGASTTMITLGTAFLLKNSPESCVVFRDKSCVYNTSEDDECQLSWDDDLHVLNSTEKFESNLSKCLQKGHKQFVIIHLTTHGTSRRSNKSWFHSNFIIIKKIPNEFPIAQHFEPHGDQGSSRKLEKALTNYFYRFNVLYMPVYMACPIGLQDIECDYEDRACKKVRNDSGGYCAAWGLFFLQTSLKFPDLWAPDIISLIGKVLDNDPKAFHKFIVNYSQFLQRNIQLLVLDEKVTDIIRRKRTRSVASERNLLDHVLKTSQFPPHRFLDDIAHDFIEEKSNE